MPPEDTLRTCPTCDGNEEIIEARPGGVYSTSQEQYYPHETVYPCPNPECYAGLVPATPHHADQ